jgi:hypothetical protein
MTFQGLIIDCGYRVDVLVEGRIAPSFCRPSFPQRYGVSSKVGSPPDGSSRRPNIDGQRSFERDSGSFYPPTSMIGLRPE